MSGDDILYTTLKEKKILHRPRSVARQLIPCGPLNWQGWNTIKLAYKLAGWPAELANSAFNQLGQYANSAGHMDYCYAKLAIFFHSGNRDQRIMVAHRAGLWLRWVTVCG